MERSRPERPAPLEGPIKKRADARKIYAEIVDELRACDDRETLEIYLMTVTEPLQQFEQELPFLWEGDGFDFLGLQGEIRKAWQRVTAEW
jgi:hypothetical protein